MDCCLLKLFSSYHNANREVISFCPCLEADICYYLYYTFKGSYSSDMTFDTVM